MTPDIYKKLEELEARIEVLEPKDKNISSPSVSPLVRRIALTLIELNGGGDPGPEEMWYEDAKRVLLDIADWLKVESEDHLGNGRYWASRLRKEADPEQDLRPPGVTLAQISEWVTAQKHAKGSRRYEWTKRVEHHDAIGIAAAALHDLAKI
jgi:hypothetical protein